MSERRGFLGEVSWFQLAASVLAAVTAAFIASRLGVAGTLVGAALGSVVVTISSAFYGRTLDRGRTLLVTTASGTIIQRHVQDGDVAETLAQAAEIDSPVQGAEFVPEPEPRLHWKAIIVTIVVVLALAMAAITTYELVTKQTLDGSGGTTIGDTFGGDKGKPRPSDPTMEPTSTPSTTPTSRPRSTAPATTPPPAASTPTPTPTPTASTSTPTPTPTAATGPTE